MVRFLPGYVVAESQHELLEPRNILSLLVKLLAQRNVVCVAAPLLTHTSNACILPFVEHNAALLPHAHEGLRLGLVLVVVAPLLVQPQHLRHLVVHTGAARKAARRVVLARQRRVPHQVDGTQLRQHGQPQLGRICVRIRLRENSGLELGEADGDDDKVVLVKNQQVAVRDRPRRRAGELLPQQRDLAEELPLLHKFLHVVAVVNLHHAVPKEEHLDRLDARVHHRCVGVDDLLIQNRSEGRLALVRQQLKHGHHLNQLHADVNLYLVPHCRRQHEHGLLMPFVRVVLQVMCVERQDLVSHTRRNSVVVQQRRHVCQPFVDVRLHLILLLDVHAKPTDDHSDHNCAHKHQDHGPHQLVRVRQRNVAVPDRRDCVDHPVQRLQVRQVGSRLPGAEAEGEHREQVQGDDAPEDEVRDCEGVDARLVRGGGCAREGRVYVDVVLGLYELWEGAYCAQRGVDCEVRVGVGDERGEDLDRHARAEIENAQQGMHVGVDDGADVTAPVADGQVVDRCDEAEEQVQQKYQKHGNVEGQPGADRVVFNVVQAQCRLDHKDDRHRGAEEVVRDAAPRVQTHIVLQRGEAAHFSLLLSLQLPAAPPLHLLLPQALYDILDEGIAGVLLSQLRCKRRFVVHVCGRARGGGTLVGAEEGVETCRHAVEVRPLHEAGTGIPCWDSAEAMHHMPGAERCWLAQLS
eukprot:Rhum_TRINITY_DN11272_c0_g2::Rhum_TRINITY_DN11272_c0_g2_i1::g.43501::m.43501